VILSSSVLTGICFILFAVSQSFYLSLVLMPFIGYGVMRQTAAANTLIQSVIPDEYRGRIMALYAMTVVGLGPFGSLAAGSLADVYGPRFTVLLGGVLGLAASAVFWMKLPSLRIRLENR
jgi:MFS family permease